MAFQPTRLKWFVIPTLAFLFALSIFPLAYCLVVSLLDYRAGDELGPRFVWWNNYLSVLHDRLFQAAAMNTGFIVLVAVTAEAILGTGLALCLHQLSWRGLQRFLETAFLLPVAMTPVAVALMWKYMFNTAYGIINYSLTTLGLPIVDWLGSSSSVLWAIVLVDVWQWTPFCFLLVLSGLRSIPEELIHMAMTDGASKLQTIRFLLLPLIRPFILVAIVLRLIDTFRIFDIVYVLTEGGPGSASETLSLYGYRQGFVFFQYGIAAAQSIILVLVLTGMSKVLLRVLRRI